MLSPRAQQLIHDYLNLPFKGIQSVRCPYFNNARLKQRGQLRVLVGKGSPREIVEEAAIISIKNHQPLFKQNYSAVALASLSDQTISSDDIRAFLINNRLGIECSGFITHVLRAHYLETKGLDIIKKLSITSSKNIFRRLIAKLRPLENIDVKVYANPQNSQQIIGEESGYDYTKIQAGDFLILLDKTLPLPCNHILLITQNNAKIITYVHARYWRSEGKYGHGVTEGTITITQPGKNLLEQIWTEKDCVGENNETYVEAATAKVIEIRRIKI